MNHPVITPDCVRPLLETPYLNVFDLQYAPGRHYYNATRRPADQLVSVKSEADFQSMTPDAVTCVVLIRTPGAPIRLLLSNEYRYPAGRFLLSPPAGLLDQEDRARPDPLFSAALREIREETGISAEPTLLRIINPLVFSSPGMTDESNALVLALFDLPDLSSLSRSGAESTECFDGFLLLSPAEARDILHRGRDAQGRFFSVYTWAALVWFSAGLWQEDV